MSDAPPPISPCCFCGKADYGPPDPTYMTLATRSEITKAWWCHVSCFEQNLPNIAKPWNVFSYEDDTDSPA